MYLVSYPLIIMAKSCSLLSVILVGIFCSRVRSKELKLGPKKIVIAVLVTLGILMFKLFDPATQMDDSRKTELVGLVLLLVSLFADGFLPDFQAEMKEKHKPRPIEMLITLNLWCGICSLAYLILTNKFIEFVQFSLYHP
jgi:RsiW-degrading membrane proteinase PrsW (M82 family)